MRGLESAQGAAEWKLCSNLIEQLDDAAIEINPIVSQITVYFLL